MEPKEIAPLFQLAAREAARFRSEGHSRKQRPLQSFQDAVAAFDETLPEDASPAEAVIEDLVRLAEPGLHMMTGPRFFGWVIGNSHPVGVAADMLASAWGQNAGNHLAAPSASAAEAIASRWILELLDLPRECSVGFVTGATVANFTCLAAARGAVLNEAGWDADSKGLFGAPPISVIIGDDAHSTVYSALQFLGLGHDRVIRVATDGQGQMLPDAFSKALAGASGPIIAVMQAGQLNTGGFDDFASLIPLAKAKGAWVHVDSAFGLWARACPSHRHLADGLDLADSWATDGHKWLQTPYDCGYAIVRNGAAHRKAMTIAASYLPVSSEADRDPSQYVPELSRRARGFATWAIIKHLGRQGIAAMVERHCRVARLMADTLAAEPGITIMNEVVLNQVSVSFGSDALTNRTIARVQEDGVCFAGGAKWRDRQVMRISVSGFDTDEAEGLKSAKAMIQAFRIVKQAG